MSYLLTVVATILGIWLCIAICHIVIEWPKIGQVERHVDETQSIRYRSAWHLIGCSLWPF